MKGAWSGHVYHLNFGGTNYISRTSDDRVIKFCAQVGYIKSQHIDDKSSLKGHGQGQVTILNFRAPVISVERLKLESPNFAHR